MNTKNKNSGEKKMEKMKYEEFKKSKDGELLKKNDYITNYEIKMKLDNNNDNEVRIYCQQYPDNFLFQIRTFKSITDKHGTGKKRNMIANVTLTIKDVEDTLKD